MGGAMTVQAATSALWPRVSDAVSTSTLKQVCNRPQPLMTQRSPSRPGWCRSVDLTVTVTLHVRTGKLCIGIRRREPACVRIPTCAGKSIAVAEAQGCHEPDETFPLLVVQAHRDASARCSRVYTTAPKGIDRNDWATCYGRRLQTRRGD